MVKRMIPIVMCLLCSSVLPGQAHGSFENLPLPAIVEKIVSQKTSHEDRLDLISILKHKKDMDIQSSRRLLGFLATCDNKDITPVARIIISYGNNDKELLFNVLYKRLNDSIDAPNDFIDLASFVDFHFPETKMFPNGGYDYLPELYAKCLEKATAEDDLLLMLSDERTHLYVQAYPELFIGPLTQKLGFFLENEVVAQRILGLFDNEDIESLKFLAGSDAMGLFAGISKMNHRLSPVANNILSAITFMPLNTNWELWIKSNPNYSVKDNALSLLDKGDLRVRAIKVLLVMDPQIFNKNEYYNYLKNSIVDDMVSLEDKKIMIGELMLRVKHEDKNNDLARVFTKTKDNGIKVFMASWMPMVPKLLDREDVEHELIMILKDPSADDRLLRGFSAYALSATSTKKKLYAGHIRDRLRGFQLVDDRPTNLFIMSLKKLTGKDCGTDLDGWTKAIDAMPDDSSVTSEFEKAPADSVQ